MAVLLRPRRWGNDKPPPNARLDHAHPLADRLVFAALLGDGGGKPYAHGVDRHGAAGDVPTAWTPTPYGRGVWLGGGGGKRLLWAPDGALKDLTGDISIAIVWLPITAGNHRNIVGKRTALFAEAAINYATNASFQWYFAAGSGNFLIASSAVPTVDRWHFTVVTRHAASARMRIWHDRRMVTDTTVVGTPTAQPGVNFAIGGQSDSSNEIFESSVGFVYVAKREWSITETQLLYLDPFAMFAPPAPRILYFPMSTPGGAADPPNLVVQTEGTTAHLTWDASPTPGVADYLVYRRTPQTGEPFVPGVDIPIASGVTDLFYDDEGLAVGDYEWQAIGRIPA